MNKLLDQTENVHHTEMQAVTPNMIGALGDLFGE